MTEKTVGIGEAESEAIPVAIRIFLEKITAENERLRIRVEELEARFAKNSGNSHKPPSSDG